MSVKQLRTSILLAAALTALNAVVPSSVWPFLFCFSLILWLRRAGAESIAAIAVLLALTRVPLYTMPDESCTQAVIREVHQSWAVASSGRSKILIFSKEPLLYDSVIRINGTLSPVSSSKGFYRFDFAGFLEQKGVYVQLDTDAIEYSGFHHTMRRALQSKIETIEDPVCKAFLYRALFGISDDSLISGSLLGSGFSYAAVLLMAESILQKAAGDKTRIRIVIFLNAFLIFFYGYRLVLVSSLIRRILSCMKLNQQERFGIWTIVMALLFQREILSAGYLIPAAFQISSMQEEKNRHYVRWTLLGMIQSFFYQKVSPFQSLFFPYVMRLNGIIWLYGLIILVFPSLAWNDLISFLSGFSLITDQLTIHGSMLGAGLPFFIILAVSFYRSEHFQRNTMILFYVFLLCGLFHPFAEITFINVGQGDAILIRGPLGSANVLIDTGKPSQYRTLCAMLEAKGIYRLDTFFVTHMDSDHSGSMEEVKRDFRPKRTITEHEGTTYSGPLVFHDLSSIDNEDENQSSIVLAFAMNGLTYVLPGDADQVSEEAIIHKFGNLHCDVLKLSHHGSKTGSCDLFLDTLKPRLGIVSSGAWQIYHHPSEETIQRLLKRHIPYLDTKNEGDITIVMAGPFSILVTSSGIIDLL